mmetsp:Transcript_15751/g.26576  ORF Transcript_15751/g.26576 Transcript_15751/m.26576 type:complete len:92 (+) Transcript_15751:140-415(+)
MEINNAQQMFRSALGSGPKPAEAEPPVANQFSQKAGRDSHKKGLSQSSYLVGEAQSQSQSQLGAQSPLREEAGFPKQGQLQSEHQSNVMRQ